MSAVPLFIETLKTSYHASFHTPCQDEVIDILLVLQENDERFERNLVDVVDELLLSVSFNPFSSRMT